MKNKTQNTSELCLCESGKTFNLCCQPYLEQLQDPATAENLMRSRYTAFVLNDEKYLRSSWHPQTCPENMGLDINTKWLGLQIKATENGKENEASGRVEFIARFKINGKAFRLHEKSRFTRHEGRWVYLDGEIIE
jgi:SEC-C motif-containing protein